MLHNPQTPNALHFNTHVPIVVEYLGGRYAHTEARETAVRREIAALAVAFAAEVRQDSPGDPGPASETE